MKKRKNNCRNLLILFLNKINDKDIQESKKTYVFFTQLIADEKLKEKIKEREKQEENKKGNKYITKKIKEILPYSHVGFDGEEPKENNQDNYI